MVSCNHSVWLKGQAASAGRRGLSALHYPGTLLPLLQLVVLKEALVTRDAVSSVWESQQAVTLDASVFKFSLKLHAVVAAENSSALELSM